MSAASDMASVPDRLQAMLQAVLERSPIDEHEARTALQEMVSAVEELRVAEEELTVQSDQLAASTEVIDAERARYVELFDFAPDAYVETDEMGKISDANRCAEELMGLAVSHLTGTLLVTFVDVDERRRFRRLLASDRSVEDEQVFTVRSRQGQETSVGVVRPTREDPRAPERRVRWLMRDLTERLRLEDRVNELLGEVDLLRSVDALQVVSATQDPVETSLERIVTVASQLLPGCVIGVTLPDHPEIVEAVTRHPIAQTIDAAQHRTGTGPCLDAARTGSVVRGPLTDWPAITSSDEAGDVLEAIGVPMTSEGVRGVLNVYVMSHPLDDRTFGVVLLLAEQAAAALATATLLRAGAEVIDQLNRRSPAGPRSTRPRDC